MPSLLPHLLRQLKNNKNQTNITKSFWILIIDKVDV
jgi:hypothetical protein